MNLPDEAYAQMLVDIENLADLLLDKEMPEHIRRPAALKVQRLTKCICHLQPEANYELLRSTLKFRRQVK
ncbi:MAG: hypothetical protein EOO38_00910 [Cytophagaceae bacterium]|nr:MAG: hypothetical protein EOO38_00910 [Cytophagaceae bacterium]